MDDTFSTFAARPENHDPAEVFQEGGGDRGVNHSLIPPEHIRWNANAHFAKGT